MADQTENETAELTVGGVCGSVDSSSTRDEVSTAGSEYLYDLNGNIRGNSNTNPASGIVNTVDSSSASTPSKGANSLALMCIKKELSINDGTTRAQIRDMIFDPSHPIDWLKRGQELDSEAVRTQIKEELCSKASNVVRRHLSSQEMTKFAKTHARARAEELEEEIHNNTLWKVKRIFGAPAKFRLIPIIAEVSDQETFGGYEGYDEYVHIRPHTEFVYSASMNWDHPAWSVKLTECARLIGG